MANKQAAKEWLVKAWHHISTANLLFSVDHYTDIIGVEAHYGIEITLKALIIHENKPLKKTHELYDIYNLVNNQITLDDSHIRLLVVATQYHILEAYPAPERTLPKHEDIEEVVLFTNELFEKVCKLLDISIDEIKSL